MNGVNARLASGGVSGEQPRPVDADGVADSCGRGRRGPARRCRPRAVGKASGRRGLSCFFGGGSRFSSSKFQRRPDGVGSVHQDVEAAALVAVEVILHPEARAVSGPLGELCAGKGERRRGQDVGDQIPVSSAGGRIVRRRTRSARAPERDARTVPGRRCRCRPSAVSRGRPDRVRRAVVPTAPDAASAGDSGRRAQRGGGLDEQDLAM